MPLKHDPLGVVKGSGSLMGSYICHEWLSPAAMGSYICHEWLSPAAVLINVNSFCSHTVVNLVTCHWLCQMA